MVGLLNEAFADCETNPDALEPLVGRLRSIDRVPHSARDAVSKVLLEQFERLAERKYMFEGRPLAAHVLDALMNLGYPWALQVDPTVVAAFDARQTRAQRKSWLALMNQHLGVVALAMAASAILLLALAANVDNWLPQWVYDLILKAINSIKGNFWGNR